MLKSPELLRGAERTLPVDVGAPSWKSLARVYQLFDYWLVAVVPRDFGHLCEGSTPAYCTTETSVPFSCKYQRVMRSVSIFNFNVFKFGIYIYDKPCPP